MDRPLPEEIARGIRDVSQRGGWNRLAVAAFALPAETWREHVARRQRSLEVRDELRAGDIYQINDLITYNLDIRQLVEDVITTCEGPELLRGFWQAVKGVTVLDPTCGSGASPFAALNIREPLPDIDFNIRPGNVLVGFVSLDEIRRAAELDAAGQGRLIYGEIDEEIRRIEEDAEIVERAFQKFHEMQSELGMDAREFAAAKQELRKCLTRYSSSEIATPYQAARAGARAMILATDVVDQLNGWAY